MIVLRTGDRIRLRPPPLYQLLPVVDETNENDDDGNDSPHPMLPRTPSMYHLDKVCFDVDPRQTYVVCAGDPDSGYVLSIENDPATMVGFGLFVVRDEDGKHVYRTRVTQVGFDYEPVDSMEFLGRADPGSYPIDRRFVGSRVMVARTTLTAPKK